MAASRPLHGSVAIEIAAAKAKAKAKANGEIESYSSSTDEDYYDEIESYRCSDEEQMDVQVCLPVDHRTVVPNVPLARQVEIFMIDDIFTPRDLPELLDKLQPQLQDNPHIVINFREHGSALVHAQTCSYLKSMLEQWYSNGKWDEWFGDDEDEL